MFDFSEFVPDIKKDNTVEKELKATNISIVELDTPEVQRIPWLNQDEIDWGLSVRT